MMSKVKKEVFQMKKCSGFITLGRSIIMVIGIIVGSVLTIAVLLALAHHSKDVSGSPQIPKPPKGTEYACTEVPCNKEQLTELIKKHGLSHDKIESQFKRHVPEQIWERRLGEYEIFYGEKSTDLCIKYSTAKGFSRI